jgi:hypothetical protein
MMATVGVLALLSTAVFGWHIWLAFYDAAREAASARVVSEMFARIYMHMTTLLAAARLVGLSESASSVLQGVGGVLAIASVWLAFRHSAQSDARLAVLATGTFLVSPYTLNYDLLLLMPASVFMFQRALAEGFHPLERLVLLMLWTLPTVGLFLNRLNLPLTPVIILAFGWFAWKRLGALKPWQLAPTSASGRKP